MTCILLLLAVSRRIKSVPYDMYPPPPCCVPPYKVCTPFLSECECAHVGAIAEQRRELRTSKK